MKGPRKSTEWRGVVRATRRLVEVRRQNDTLLAAYRYNGLNQRITWHYDADEDGDTDGSDPVYHFCYDDKWRIVGTWRGADTDPKELFIYHNAGLAGRGGSSYIDSVVLRDRDMNGGGGWTGASDGTLEARHYYAQNWRADVSAIFDNAGDVLEWHKYSAYGIPFLLTPGDHDKNGAIDKDDETLFNANFGASNPLADLNKDGVVNSADQALFTASFNKTTPGGRWKLSAADVANRKGYAGYEHEGFGNDLAAPEIAHVRNRVLHFGLGRWTRRDPLGYVDGRSLNAFVRSSPIRSIDPMGLVGQAASGGGGCTKAGIRSGGQPCSPIDSWNPFRPPNSVLECIERCANYGPPSHSCLASCATYPVTIPLLPTHEQALCQQACTGREGGGTVICVSGQPVACACPHRASPEFPSLIDQMQRCAGLHELINITVRNDCTDVPDGGPPHAPDARTEVCNELVAMQMELACMRLISCSAEGAPNSRARCRCEALMEGRVAEAECRVAALQMGCNSPSPSMPSLALYDACKITGLEVAKKRLQQCP